MRDYRNLKVWQRAYEFALKVYRATEKFPRREMFGLAGQIRRAAVSICSNIAEGRAWDGSREFARFLKIAMGSCNEVECQVQLSGDLGFMDKKETPALLNEVAEIRCMLVGLWKSLNCG